MTTTPRAPRTSPEDKKAQAEALHANIATQVEALRDSGQWQCFLDFAQSFHTYSLNNLLLILAQRSDATAVAGFRAWQIKGRQVRKGEHGIRIFGYRQHRITEEDDDGKETERTINRYPILTVFDISQTDPIDGEPDTSQLARPLNGTDDHDIYAKVSDHLAARGWTVQRGHLPSTTNGLAQPAMKLVIINESLSPKHAAKTALHEAAHIQLDHTADLTKYATHRGLMETEAESVAYIVAGLHDIDTSDYSIGYIAGWSGADTELIRNTAARVLHAAHLIAAALDPAGTPDVDETQG